LQVAKDRWPKFIDQSTGKRSDTATEYIYSQESNTNLVILDKRKVQRIIFEDYRAVGVEYVHSGAPGSSGCGTVEIVYCSQLVVVAAGTFGSPGILERSGIGSRDILEANGIEVLIDLPGVGGNYLDHIIAWVPYIADENMETLDEVFRGEDSETVRELDQEWLKSGGGLLSSNGIDAGIKMRPNEEDLKNFGHSFQDLWATEFLPYSDKPLLGLGCLSGFIPLDPDTKSQKYLSMATISLYPISSGSVHISSGKDTNAPCLFEFNMLQKQEDLDIMRWGYKKGREIARRMPSYRGEYVRGHPLFRKGSNAVTAPRNGPYNISDPDIVYSEHDDAAIDAFHRRLAHSSYHSLGTCAMCPQSKYGVVDSSLNVYGVSGLKIADLSICPSNVGANTCNTAQIIGEKAALIIANELEIKLT